MRIVNSADEIEQAHKRCQSEALRAFGSDAVYVERLIPRARHIEVQIVGDGSGAVSHIGERECSVQRRHQKLVEIAPSPSITPEVREAVAAAAVRLAQAVNYRSLGTFEFLVDESNDRDFFFIEANARLQVEHTVTEEVSGIDLVQAQLRIAGGDTLASLQLEQASIPSLRGYAIQARVNTETIEPDGNLRPTGGELSVFHLPSGPGIRVDTSPTCRRQSEGQPPAGCSTCMRPTAVTCARRAPRMRACSSRSWSSAQLKRPVASSRSSSTS